MDDQYKVLSEVANEVGTSADTVRYWCRLLGVQVARRGKYSVVPIAAIVMLAAVYRLVNDGVSPGQACQRVLSQPLEIEPQSTTAVATVNQSADRIGNLERAIMVMIEANKADSAAVRAEAAAARQETALLRAQVAALSSMIEARRALPPLLLEAPTPVTAWSPPPPRPRLEGVRRWVAHLVNPASLRRR